MEGSFDMKNITTNSYMSSKEQLDILDNSQYKLNEDILQILLTDRTTNKNILWCTDNYTKYGIGYNYNDAIEIYSIIGKRSRIIKPRTKK